MCMESKEDQGHCGHNGNSSDELPTNEGTGERTGFKGHTTEITKETRTAPALIIGCLVNVTFRATASVWRMCLVNVTFRATASVWRMCLFKPMQLLWKLHWQGTPSNRCSCSESYIDKAQPSNRCSCSESYIDKAQPSNRCSCSESYIDKAHPSNRCSCSESYIDKAQPSNRCSCSESYISRHTFKPMQLLWKLHWQGTPSNRCSCSESYTDKAHFKPMQLLWKLHC